MSEESKLVSDIPAAEKLLLEAPLYQEYPLSNVSQSQLRRLESFRSSVDAYCVECKQHSIFWGNPTEQLTTANGGTAVPGGVRTSKYVFRDRHFYVVLECSRINNHRMLFFFKIRHDKLIKFGQHPSIADLHLKGIDRYRGTLGKETYAEFARAVGLYAHGVGIGSFVYLRRIFESLVNEAYEQASRTQEWDDDAFQRARMDQKVVLLKNHLPQILVDNAGIYSILSKGIHSLTEDECLKHFTTVKLGIELILDEKIERQERQKKIKAVADELSRIKGDLS